MWRERRKKEKVNEGGRKGGGEQGDEGKVVKEGKRRKGGEI